MNKEDFRKYLQEVAVSKRTKSHFSSGAVTSYLSFLKKEKIFDYAPDKWENAKEFYEITEPEELKKIIDDLKSDSLFVNRDVSDNQYYRSNALEQYYNFLLYKKGIKEIPSENLPVEEENTLTKQTIFFGAPGTGKSFKVNSILPNEDIWSVYGEIRKQLFLDSDTAKKSHYAEVLDNKETFGDIWNVNDLSILEGKLSEVNSEDNVSNPEHSALQAYIKFLKEYKFERVFRTTFHPDYDYAQFVGTYKPKKEGNAITYSFVPQVFAKAYAAAWMQYFASGNESTAENQVYLVIEEINRGNCAQIFGDIFQLLDRVSDSPDKGFSQYSIDADCDFATWLKEDSILKTVWSEYETKVGDGKLKLPPNLNILATMNTSDQSLFPMDSAFKRRFDWEYVPINYEKSEADFIVGDASFNFNWLHFLKKVNADIYKVTQSEDKQMGEFFIKPKNKDYITLDEFRSKVLFYLWDSVYKDELDSKLVFHFAYPEKGPDVTFQRLFNSDFVEILKKMLANLDNEYKDGAQILISSGANS